MNWKQRIKVNKGYVANLKILLNEGYVTYFKV